MGNSLHGAGLLSNDLHFPYHIQLGSYLAIDIDGNNNEILKRNSQCNILLPKKPMMWTMSYNVDGSKCRLEFEKYFNENHKVNMAMFTIHDDICSGAAGIYISVTKSKNNDLQLLSSHRELCFGYGEDFFDSCNTQFNSNDNNTLGVITETTVIAYGSGWKGGHVIIEK